MTRALPAALALLLSACAGPELLNTVARNPDRGTTVVRDVAYGDGERQVMDLYVPDRAGPHPVLMFVHGGSWRDGDKDAYAFAGKRFAAEGFLTAVPSYTVLPEGTYEVVMADMAAALRTLIEASPAQGGDPERVFLTGHSAGGYNVVQLALAPEFLEAEGLTPSIIGAVSGLSGPYDFLPLDPGVELDVFGSADTPEETQPVLRVTADAPPMILITGADDETVQPRNATALAAALTEAGVRAETRIYEGVDHAGVVVAVAFPKRNPTVADTVAFFASEGAFDASSQ